MSENTVTVGWKVWMLLIFFMLTIIVGFGSGYLTAYNKAMIKDDGIVFTCLQLYKDHRVNCSTSWQINNVTVTVISDFDALKIIGDFD